MATRREVAQLAGVSVATVSNVLNRSKRVTPEVTHRVLEAAEALNYRPNLLARSLTTRESRHVVMLVDSLINPRSVELLAGAQAAASENGYLLSVAAVRPGDPRGLRELVSRGVDGVLIAPTCDHPRITEQIDPDLTAVRVDPCAVDFNPAMDDLLRHLRDLGHERIAFLGGVAAQSAEQPRYSAWRAAMARAGLEIDSALILDIPADSPADEAEGQRAMAGLLKRSAPFTAVCAVSDQMALGAIRALARAGFSVPHDISVIGCDHLRALAGLTPFLTSIDARTFDLGGRLFGHLLSVLRSQTEPRSPLPARYIPGETTACAAACAAGELLPR